MEQDEREQQTIYCQDNQGLMNQFQSSPTIILQANSGGLQFLSHFILPLSWVCSFGFCAPSSRSMRSTKMVVAGEPVSRRTCTETPSTCTSAVRVGPSHESWALFVGNSPCIVAATWSSVSSSSHSYLLGPALWHMSCGHFLSG